MFKLQVESNHTKCLERQIKEGVSIKNFKNSDADIVMNSKAEFHQPAVRRVTTTREVGLWLFRTEFYENFCVHLTASCPKKDNPFDQIITLLNFTIKYFCFAI